MFFVVAILLKDSHRCKIASNNAVGMTFKNLTLVTLSKNVLENLKSSHSSRVTTDLML